MILRRAQVNEGLGFFLDPGIAEMISATNRMPLNLAEKQNSKLLPVPYSMVTFTVPEEKRAFMRPNQKLSFDRFFQE